MNGRVLIRGLIRVLLMMKLRRNAQFHWATLHSSLIQFIQTMSTKPVNPQDVTHNIKQRHSPVSHSDWEELSRNSAPQAQGFLFIPVVWGPTGQKGPTGLMGPTSLMGPTGRSRFNTLGPEAKTQYMSSSSSSSSEGVVYV